MKNNKILYLTAPYPFPAEFGGAQGHVNIIQQLINSKFINNIFFFFSNLENEVKYKFPYDKTNYKIFTARRNVSLFFKIIYSFFSLYGYSLKRVATKELKNEIIKLKPSIIIIDGYYCSLAIPKNKYLKKIYITHNIEFKLSLDVAKIETNVLKKIWLYLKALKMAYIENNLFRTSDKIICISKSDYDFLIKKFPTKTHFLPHNITNNIESWTYNDDKTLFFCGAYDFAPNKDAIDWIVNTLAPKLNPCIKIKIAGKDTDKLSRIWNQNNIEFLGFVSEEKLVQLYCQSSAFICPIIYGSGIKMKILEALSYKTPIIATVEALQGLNNLDIAPLINRNDLSACVSNIENLLFNETKIRNYQKYIDHIVQDSSKKNNNWDVIFEELSKEVTCNETI